ncbi:MAG TPA: hypothetical protein VFA79_02055 [Myxococcales bacterium]|nr:hypothetical protein [Myxococcales bacterium]
MTSARLAAVLPALLACGARLPAPDLGDGGTSQPTVSELDPEPGVVAATARFTVRFSAAMDEGQLLAASGRSESVALAAEADAERAAAALEHAPLSAHERTLLVAAAAEVASDRRAISISPDQPLSPGDYSLLVSARLKDESGRKLSGNGRRFGFHVAAPPPTARLVTPPPGGEVPWNLGVVRAFAEAGRVALLGPKGEELASADAHGAVALTLPGPLGAGSDYVLALGGVALPEQTFTAASCARTAAPALQGGAAQISVRDTGITAQVVLDWPAEVEATVEDARGTVITAQAQILCAPPPCGPQSFACAGAVRIEGLQPASDYTLRIAARDDFGFTLRSAAQPFGTLASLPKAMISEVMASGIDGEYVEIFNLGPGAADLETLALLGADGIVRPLLGGAAPLPVVLAPGARALAVGASFDAGLYPELPPGTPILRAATQRLLGRGLSDDAPPPFTLVARGETAVAIADFPGAAPRCGAGISLQRDEAVAADSPAAWICGRTGGTPGRPP